MTGQLSQEALGLLQVEENKNSHGISNGSWNVVSLIGHIIEGYRDSATAFPVSIGEQQQRIHNGMHLSQPTPFVHCLLITNTYCRCLSEAAVIAGLV